MQNQPVLSLNDLSNIAEAHSDALDAQVANFDIGGTQFNFNSKPNLMGVINLSTDSWYRESVCLSTESAVERGLVLHEQGAALVDLGAESTLFDAARADNTLQESRLIPVVSQLSSRKALVSVETYLPSVARACLEAGAKVLNITGPEHAIELYKLAAAHEAAVIICHVQGPNVREVSELRMGDDLISEMSEFFERETGTAVKAGVSRILIDPGLGFYYSNLQDSSLRVRYQMQTFLNTFRLRKIGWPVCHALPHAFEYFKDEVRCAEPFFAVLAALGKTSLFRTHEISKTRAVLETMGVWNHK